MSECQPLDLVVAVTALLASISSDEARHGGLLSRTTIRCADDLRLAVAAERRRKGQPEPAEPAVERQPGGPL
jgi:hypothetical protein